jgi:hypothetical protein
VDINAQFSINNLAKSQEKKKVFILIVSCRCANNTLKDIASHRKELLLTDPRFFGHVTVNTHIFFFGLALALNEIQTHQLRQALIA